MSFGNNLIDFNSLGIKRPLTTIFQAQSLMRVVDDNVDWETGAILDDDGVVFTEGDTTPQGATLLREQEYRVGNQVRYEDATEAERATALEQGNVYNLRDTTSQAHQDLFDEMGRFTGSGEVPQMYGDGVGGEGTNTFIYQEESIFRRAWCLIGDCSEVNTNTQRELDWMDDEYEEEYDEEESEETNTNAQGLGLGLSGMTQADEEQLADKADETHISGGNESKNQTSASSENQYALIGVLLLGAGYGAYKYESNTSFFSKTWNKLRKSIKR
jgi:hypothetical protein|tara:strand:+ start:6114 stop:6929 length:816 start_codon:yes stop_codon:yes gene_type:complete